MDSIIDVVGREKIEAGEVILYPEGIFYRAYGCSALRFVRNIRSYQVKKRHYKKLGAEVCYLGFPQVRSKDCSPKAFRPRRRLKVRLSSAVRSIRLSGRSTTSGCRAFH